MFERGKTDTAFQEQLMQPTNGMGLLSKIASNHDVASLRYLCQQDGMEAHAFNRDSNSGKNILAYYCCQFGHRKIEIIELLLDNFPWLLSERGGGDEAVRSSYSVLCAGRIRIAQDHDGRDETQELHLSRVHLHALGIVSQGPSNNRQRQVSMRHCDAVVAVRI